ncbi:glycosyltransferase family 2 protein [Candidatus Uhrbacteria bacterium]|nr:glycosyltransferase family 2 protein [Candidatus Uhrbacteria bacterium]
MTETISIHLVTWNSARHLPALLESIQAQSEPRFSVRVVDNASEDRSREIVREQFPSALLMRNARNNGFASAHNQAIRYALDHWEGEDLSDKYIVLINPDIILKPTCLEELLRVARAHPSASCVGAKLLRTFTESGSDEVLSEKTPSDIIDSLGLHPHRNRSITEWRAGELDRDPHPAGRMQGTEGEEEEVFGISGALALYRASALADASAEGAVFDPSFFSYKEDVDLAWRLRWLGYEAWCAPRAAAFHERGMAAPSLHGFWARVSHRRRQPDRRKYYSNRNHWLLLIKNESAGSLFLSAPWILLHEAKRVLYTLCIEPLGLGAFASAFLGFPRAWKARRLLISRRRVSPKDMRKWFV